MNLAPLKKLRLDTALATRLLYATDASLYRAVPAGVLFPRSVDEIAKAVAIAHEYEIPLLPRGAGTSLAGQAISTGVVMDLSRFNAIRLDPNRAACCVETGAVIDAIDRVARARKLYYGPAPASSNRATIGGLISNNGTGARSIAYGMSSDHVLSMRVLLADGTVRTFARGDLDRGDALTSKILSIIEPVMNSARLPRTWRNASGLTIGGVRKYESLFPLFCGAEGSLGVMLDAEISLVPQPERTFMALFTFDDLISAMKAVAPLLAVKPLAVELMDRRLIELARDRAHFTPTFIDTVPAALLAVEFDAEESISAYTALGAAKIIRDAATQNDVWRTRKEGLGILMSARSKRRPAPFIEDCSVPVDRLPEYVARVDEIITRNGSESAYYAHASAGCLHIRPLLDLKNADDRARMERIMSETCDLLVELGGSLTGEHGDGRSKRPFLERFFGPELSGAFAAVKRAFDPNGIFSMRGENEFRIDQPARTFTPFMKWESDFTTEVERCNGEAACRKSDGVMCPSYQASQDESLSTRGRANLLRAWLAGDDVDDGLKRTLSKCLACKGCATECPSEVDMSKLKAEFMHRMPHARADHLFANFAALSEIGRLFGIPFQSIIKRFFGIHANMELKRPRRNRFSDLHRGRADGAHDALLFVDTHLEYYEPEIGEALLEICAAIGVKLLPMKTGCCGRPAYSRGLLAMAKAQIERMEFPGEKEIIVVEPSCYSMLKTDALNLSEKAASISPRVITAESFLLRYADRIEALAPAKKARVLHHSHCHQKAMKIDDEGARLLRLVATVGVLECGCCGMAGSFGYEKENYNLSLAIAEQDFLPKLRAWAGDFISISGRSCREMAERHGIAAKHPIQVLRELITIKSV